MSRYFSAEDLIELARSQINYETTQRDLATRWGISYSYLSDFLAGKRGPGPAILKGLGFDEKPFYRRQP